MSEASAVSQPFLKDLFALEERVAVVTGATGVLGSAVARGLARAGARVGVLGRRPEEWSGKEDEGVLMMPRAGELLYRLGDGATS